MTVWISQIIKQKEVIVLWISTCKYLNRQLWACSGSEYNEIWGIVSTVLNRPTLWSMWHVTTLQGGLWPVTKAISLHCPQVPAEVDFFLAWCHCFCEALWLLITFFYHVCCHAQYRNSCHFQISWRNASVHSIMNPSTLLWYPFTVCDYSQDFTSLHLISPDQEE